METKDAGRFATAGAEQDFSIVKQQRSVAGSEGGFAQERRGKIIARERIPMLAVLGAEEQEFAVDSIAERDAFLFRYALQCVEKKLLPLVCVLQVPGIAAVGCFVNARLFAFLAAHQVGNLRVQRRNSAKAERLPAGPAPTLPCFAFVDGFQKPAI